MTDALPTVLLVDDEEHSLASMRMALEDDFDCLTASNAAEAEKLGVPLLAEVPLDLQIRLASDGGAPIVTSKPDSAQAQAFHAIASALVAEGVA